MERRALALRRGVRDGGLREVPFDCRLASQANNSRACRWDSFLTFLTASSTALMVETLSKKMAWSKQGFEEVPVPRVAGTRQAGHPRHRQFSPLHHVIQNFPRTPDEEQLAQQGVSVGYDSGPG
jgi:hypothetical protein